MLDGSSAIVDIANLKEGVNSVNGFTVISDYEDFGHYHPMKCYLTVKNGLNFMYDYAEFDYWIDLPRRLDEEVARFYITPNNPEIKQIANNIKDWPKWLALVNWVADNIDYPDEDADGDGKPNYDFIKHGRWEYWQLPTETLSLRTGDCEDFAILLCSLLRASGYDENSVYVVLGYTESEGHAWVRIYAQVGGVGMWFDVEPQVGGLWTIYSGIKNLLEYDEAFLFNDVHFERLK